MSYFFCKAEKRTGETETTFKYMVEAETADQAKVKAWSYLKDYFGDVTGVNEEDKQVELDYGTSLITFKDDVTALSDAVGEELRAKNLM